MTAAYWDQWDSTELLSMHGIERDDHQYDEDKDEDGIDEEDEDVQNSSRYCQHCGCAYCSCYDQN